MATCKPLARYGIWRARFASGLSTSQLHHEPGHNRRSPIKLSLDRPELGSNPHGSPLRQRRFIAVCAPTRKRKNPPRSHATCTHVYSSKIKQSFMDTH